MTPEAVELLRLIAIELMIGFGAMTILLIVIAIGFKQRPAARPARAKSSAPMYQPDSESELSDRLHTLQRMRFAPAQGVEPMTRLPIPQQGRMTIQRKKA